MEAQPIALAPCTLMLFWAGLLLPPSERDDWRQEWLAESWYRYYLLCRSDEWSWRNAWQLYRDCAGCFEDARSQFSFDGERWNALQRQARSPFACLAALLVALVSLCCWTGFCPVTRTILSSLPYPNAERLSLVSRTGRFESIRRSIPRELADYWRAHSRLLQSMAACYLVKSGQIDFTHGAVNAKLLMATPNLFAVLEGDLERAQPQASVMLSDRFWRSQFAASAAVIGHHFVYKGRDYRIAGVLPASFWFLSPSIDAYAFDAQSIPEQATLVVRTRTDVSSLRIENDLLRVAQEGGAEFFRTAPHVLSLHEAIHTPLWLFGGACLLAGVLALIGFSSRFTRRRSLADLLFKTSWRWWVFLLAKTALMLLLVLILGLEYFVGGTQSANEALGGPALLWFYVVGCSAAVFAAATDQKSRCRVCLHTLALPVRIGCPGCFFLEWSGTEFMCPEGHGMLYVPHHVSCWEEQDRWVALSA